MNEVIEKLIQAGIVAVIRSAEAEVAEQTALACLKGGITALEITFSTPGADKVFTELTKDKKIDALIGAGTILNAKEASHAIDQGAQFIVSPICSKEIGACCALKGIPYIPGCFSPTEIEEGLRMGCELIKLFPASSLGPSYIKEIHGPFPMARFMPTGGVNLQNALSYLQSGASVLGVGGSLNAAAKKGDYSEVEHIAFDLMAVVKGFRESH